MDRNKFIIRTSITGIVANVMLALFKAFAGLVSHSIAIVLDAVNNLSDAMSSAITIIGTKLASKQPDREHPYGHGRIEYLSTVTIALIMLYAGITSFAESAKKVVNPSVPKYSAVSLVIVGVSVAVKILLGLYVKRNGKKVNSDALTASGQDALLDSLISLSTLVTAFIYIFFGLSLESWVGVFISLVIVKSGYGTLKDSISEILGERADGELSRNIKDTVMSFDSVSGVYDLVMHNYGPDMMIASVHIEVPDIMTVSELDFLERQIADSVFDKYRVILSGISVYSANTADNRTEQVHQEIRKIVMSYGHVLQMHGFYFNEEKKIIRFDIIIDYSIADRQLIYSEISQEVSSLYPDYSVSVTLDADASD